MRTEVLTGVLVGALIGCGGDGGEECGPGDEPAGGITAAVDAETIRFDGFVSSPNNDCTPTGESGPTSLTVQGTQAEPSGTGFFILCLPRPDELGGGPIAIGDADRVLVIDLVGEADGCEVDLDRDRPLEGEVTFDGLCDDGTNPQGYAMSFAASLPLIRSCEGQEDQAIDAAIAGRASVSAP